MATTAIGGSIYSSACRASLDEKYGPYDSVVEAYTAVAEVAAVGLTVGVKATEDSIEEYWFQGGTEESHLVKKQPVDSEVDGDSENAVQNKAVHKALDGKQDKEIGKGLSTNDFDNEAKDKLASFEFDTEAHTLKVNGNVYKLSLVNEG